MRHPWPPPPRLPPFLGPCAQAPLRPRPATGPACASVRVARPAPYQPPPQGTPACRRVRRPLPGAMTRAPCCRQGRREVGQCTSRRVAHTSCSPYCCTPVGSRSWRPALTLLLPRRSPHAFLCSPLAGATPWAHPRGRHGTLSHLGRCRMPPASREECASSTVAFSSWSTNQPSRAAPFSPSRSPAKASPMVRWAATVRTWTREGRYELTASISGRCRPTPDELAASISGRCRPTRDELTASISGRCRPTRDELTASISGRCRPTRDELTASISDRCRPTPIRGTRSFSQPA